MRLILQVRDRKRAKLKLRRRELQCPLHSSPVTDCAKADALGFTPFKVNLWSGGAIREAICTRPPSAAPATICFDTNRDETLSFLAGLRKKVRDNSSRSPKRVRAGSRTRIAGFTDFSSIKYIGTSAAVVLAASYDAAARTAKRKPTTVNVMDWNENVFNTLFEIGFFHILGHINDAKERYTESGTLRTMSLVTGTNSNELKAASQKILSLIKHIGDEATLSGRVLRALNSALGEAMTNVANHAYPNSFKAKKAEKIWWVSASADRSTRELRIVIYDQGATIPATLPRTTRGREIVNKLQEVTGLDYRVLNSMLQLPSPTHPYDDQYIEYAVGDGTSQTGNIERGQGLPQIKDLIDTCREGSLTILSRGGYYSYTPQRQRRFALLTPLSGTLIEWGMTIPQVEGHGE